jgi:chromosome segregation ATPase
MIRELGEQTLPPTLVAEKPKTKSVAAKDAQIVRLKERLETSERKVVQLQQDNEKLFGKLAIQDSKSAALNIEVERVRQSKQELKQRIDRLEAENLGLRNLLREVHGLSGSELVEKLESQRQEVEQLMTKNKELKAQLTGMEFLVTELEELKKEKQRLFNRVVQLEVVEREKSKRGITEAISRSRLQITDVEN